VNEIPTEHMGPTASAMEKKGIRTAVGDRNRETMNTNREIAGLKAELNGIEKQLLNEYQRIYAPPENLNQVSATIWSAWARRPDAKGFSENLQEHGMQTIRVTKQDAAEHRERAEQARDSEVTKYMPQPREGDYAVITDRGTVYPLNRRTTGDERETIERIMSPIKDTLPGLGATLNAIHDRAANLFIQQEMQGKLWDVAAGKQPISNSRPAAGGGEERASPKVAKGFHKAAQAITKGASLLDSLISVLEHVVDGIAPGHSPTDDAHRREEDHKRWRDARQR
jgi:hypothetical protein